MYRFFAAYSVPKNILFLLGIVLLFRIVLFPSLLPEAEMLDTRFSYTAKEAYEIIDDYRPDVRRGFILSALTLDMVFPFAYSVFFSFLLFFLFKRTLPALFPFSAMFLDYLENTGIVILLTQYPQKIMSLAALTGVFTTLKWILLLGTMILLAAGCIRKIVVTLYSSPGENAAGKNGE
ncbi:MAG: hypothetical protein U5N56_01960 [Candidatus Marinimicrobia bacterium]|nr:hypothetical protein [Candidatus Neomarinimicrobiota bacterium]